MSLIFLLVLILLFTLFGVLAFAIIRRASWRRGSLELPCCGACQYCVRGLENHICPECGSNLNEVGVITDGTSVRSARGPFSSMIAWSILCFLGVLIIGPLVITLTPNHLRWRGQNTMTLTQPESGAHAAVSFTQRYEAPGGGSISDPVVLTIRGAPDSPDEPVRLVVDVVGGTCSLVQNERTIAEELPVTRSTIRRWFDENNVRGEERLLVTEADAILVSLEDPEWTAPMRTYGGSFSSSGTHSGNPVAGYRRANSTSSGSSDQIPPWQQYAVLGGAVVVWLTGLFIIIRKRQREDGP